MYFCIILILLAAKHRALNKLFIEKTFSSFSSSTQSLKPPLTPKKMYSCLKKKKSFLKHKSIDSKISNVFYIKIYFSCFYAFECEFYKFSHKVKTPSFINKPHSLVI